jgi:ATP-dependent 26S proteasome regulatory subunit
MSFEEEIVLFIKAKSPLIYIVCAEEERVEYALRRLMTSKLKRVVYSWDFVNGFTPNVLNESYKRNPFEALSRVRNMFSQVPSLILFKDFQNFLSDLSISRELRNLLPIIRTQPKTLVFVSNQKIVPNELIDKFVFIEFGLPNVIEIEKELSRLFNTLNIHLSNEVFTLLVNSCRGLSLEKIRHLIAKSIASKKQLDFSTVDLILHEKQQIISRTEILEFWQPGEHLQDIGGLEGLKSWLNKRRLHFSESAKNYGLPVPRGILLVGVQGTGKSMTAKAIANDWFLPLLRLDTGRLFGGVVGESERRIREMIEIAESLSPCVLWIDEIEKSLSNTNQSGDSGTTSRVLSTLLTWLAEKKAFVFVVATANALENIQLELIRKGRFDEIFFLDLPTKNERKSIFDVHLKSFRPESWEMYDTNELSQLTPSFSGAEIKQLIIEAMYQAFSEGREFKNQDIIKEIDRSIPLAKLHQESVQKLQSWARSGRIRLGSIDTLPTSNES